MKQGLDSRTNHGSIYYLLSWITVNNEAVVCFKNLFSISLPAAEFN